MRTQLGQAIRDHVQRSVELLAQEFTGVFSRETIDAYVQESLDQFASSRIQEFVPLMVERFARQRLRALAQAEGKVTKEIPEVLFVCVHNSGRSQMAAGLLDKLAAGRVHVRSAGSDPADQLNPNAVKAMEEAGVDISKEFPKPLTDEVVRAADVVITMGCGDACPISLASDTRTGTSRTPPARTWRRSVGSGTRSAQGRGADPGAHRRHEAKAPVE